MRTYLKLFCLILPILIALDASWIGVIASGLYQQYFGAFLTPTPNFLAAGLFYILYSLALIYFALMPALHERSLGRAMMAATLLGFTAYMTYDLTNLATLAGWPVLGSVVDVAWGALMSGVAAGLTLVIATKVFRL